MFGGPALLLTLLLCALLFCVGQLARPRRHLGQQRGHGYIIHLPARVDRAANVAALVEAADQAGVHLRVVDAVDGRGCEDLSVAPFWDFSILPGHVRAVLRGGEQGCLASHLHLFRTDHKAATGCFFLEDDALMSAAGFAEMNGKLRSLDHEAAVVLHGMRALPAGWPTRQEALERESRQPEGDGWRRLSAPNYSTALFAVSPAGVAHLRRWSNAIVERGLHNVPADDFLSIACAIHPGISVPPMRETWGLAPPGPLRALAPTLPLSSRMLSLSDTEHREPLEGVACGTSLRACRQLPTLAHRG